MLRFFLILFLLTFTAPVHATISSTTSRMDYTGNGAVDTYSYSYKIFANTDLLVTVRNTSDVETTLTLTTDYTVTGVGSSSGGNVVLVNSAQSWLDGDGDLKSNYILTIRRVRPIKQLTDIRNQGAFYPEVHEDTFDSLVMIGQQQQDEIDRSMKLSETTDPDDFSTILPASLIDNPGASIIVNDDGDGFTDGPTADAIAAAQANAASAALDAATASAAAIAAAASAASINLPSFASNSLNVLQVNSDATAYQYLDLRAPNVGIGTTTPNAGKFTTLQATGTTTVVATTATGGYTQTGSGLNLFSGNVGIGTLTAGSALKVVGTVSATTFTGANVTSGANPGHTHTSSSVGSLVGAPVSRSDNTVYQAATDGEFCGVITCGTSSINVGKIEVYTDASNPPTTLMTGANCSVVASITSETATGNVDGFCIDIRNGEYYKGVLSSSAAGGGSTGASATYTFKPIGS